MTLTFDEDGPPPVAGHRWDDVLAQLKERPGVWAKLEDESYRTYDYLSEKWADEPVELTMRKLARKPGKKTRRGELWLRWVG